MKRVMWMAVLALPLAAQPARAQFFQQTVLPPMKLDGGITLKFNLFGGGGMTQLGPWYQYWPHEAHFQAPPPLGASMPGPTYMTLPPQFGQQGGGMPGAPIGGQPNWSAPQPTPVPPPQNNPNTQRSSFQPVGYWVNGQAPAYWYGR